MTARSPSILKPRAAQPAKMSFQCDAALAERLAALERTAKAAGLEIDIDEPLAATLARFITQAERKLSPPAKDLPNGRATQATSQDRTIMDRDGFPEPPSPTDSPASPEIPE